MLALLVQQFLCACCTIDEFLQNMTEGIGTGDLRTQLAFQPVAQLVESIKAHCYQVIRPVASEVSFSKRGKKERKPPGSERLYEMTRLYQKLNSSANIPGPWVEVCFSKEIVLKN